MLSTGSKCLRRGILEVTTECNIENLTSYTASLFMAIFQFLPPFDRENYLGKSGDIVKETTLGILYLVLYDFKENKRF